METHSIISPKLLHDNVWNIKRPRLKRSILQCKKSGGGWACPNFKLYHWPFVLQCLHQLVREDKMAPWKNLEQEVIFPMRLEDFVLLGLSTIKCAFQFGPIFSHLLHVFKTVERCVGFKGI